MDIGVVVFRRTRTWLRIVSAAMVLTVVAIAAALVHRSRHHEPSSPSPERLPANVNQRLSGYTFTRSEGPRPVFRIHASRTMAFAKSQATILEDVTAELFNKAGSQRDVLRAGRCEYSPVTGAFACPGNVTIELHTQREGLGSPVSAATTLKGRYPVYLETSSLSFDPTKSLVTTNQPVRFSLGPASGSATGAAYATRDGWLELKKDVTFNWPLQNAASSGSSSAEGRGPPEHASRLRQTTGSRSLLVVKAARARYEKSSGQVNLGGPLQIAEEGRRANAGGGTIFLNTRNRVVSMRLNGHVQALDSSPLNPVQVTADSAQGEFNPDSEDLRRLLLIGDVRAESRRRPNPGTDRDESVGRLEAHQLQIDFQGSGADRSVPAGKRPSPAPLVPVYADATGNVRATLQSTSAPQVRRNAGPRPGERELTAREVIFSFRPGLGSLRETQTVGPGKLVLAPADDGDRRKTITAGQFIMIFDDRSRLQNLHGLAPCHVVFEPPARSTKDLQQETFSDRLDVTVTPVTQELAEVRQTGHFEFRQRNRRARAEQAHYVASSRRLTLTGSPDLWDPDSRLRARRVVLQTDSETVVATGEVQSTYSAPGQGGPSTTRESTNVLADRVTSNRKKGAAHYEGHVRAWRGFDVLESPWLDIRQAERRVSAGDGVLASFLQPGFESPGLGGTQGNHLPADGTRPLTIRAERLNYLDADRRARFEGHVRSEMGDMTLTADQLDAFFSAPAAAPAASMMRGTEPPRVERLVAGGHVVATEPLRHATSDRAEYFASQGRIVLTGGPPAVYDGQNGFTTGRRLTFFTRDDSLRVDGGDRSPAVSKRRITH